MNMNMNSCDSLRDVLGLPASASIGSALSLIVGVDKNATSSILKSLLSTTHDELLSALLLLDFRCLVSDLTITGH
jgi:hypothetical protein